MRFILVLWFVCCLGNVQVQASLMSDVQAANAINKKMCEEGTHGDETAAKFFACYGEVEGAKVFKDCQTKIYGNPLDTEAHIDAACKADKYTRYTLCLTGKFVTGGINPIEAMRKVNNCQGPLLGVEIKEKPEMPAVKQNG